MMHTVDGVKIKNNYSKFGEDTSIDDFPIWDWGKDTEKLSTGYEKELYE